MRRAVTFHEDEYDSDDNQLGSPPLRRNAEDLSPPMRRDAEDLSTPMRRNAEDLSPPMRRNAEDISPPMRRNAEDLPVDDESAAPQPQPHVSPAASLPGQGPSPPVLLAAATSAHDAGQIAPGKSRGDDLLDALIARDKDAKDAARAKRKQTQKPQKQPKLEKPLRLHRGRLIL